MNDKMKITTGRLFVQASDTSHRCDHPELVILRQDAGAIQCESCGKRWRPTLKKSSKAE